MAHIYLRWKLSDDHPVSFYDYQELLQNDDEKYVKIELNYVMDVILAFEWKEEHNLSYDERMYLIFQTKWELLIHKLYDFEVQRPERKYWKLFYSFCNKIWLNRKASKHCKTT